MFNSWGVSIFQWSYWNFCFVWPAKNLSLIGDIIDFFFKFGKFSKSWYPKHLVSTDKNLVYLWEGETILKGDRVSKCFVVCWSFEMCE